MKKILYIFLFFPACLPAQVHMFFGADPYAAPLMPLDVDSIFYWFAADVGVFDSVGNPISNFQGVGEWKDLSGRGHHVLQTTNGNRPQYQLTGGPNNRPALYFDGTNDFLASAPHFWESDDISLFIVYKEDSSTTGTRTVIRKGSGSPSNTRQFFFRIEDLGITFISSSTGGAGSNQPIWTDGPRVATPELSTHISDGAGAASLHRNGVSQSYTLSGSTTHSILDSATPATTIGAGNLESSITDFFKGSISEVIVYSRALTTAEREGIEAYLNHKYKIY